MEVSTLSEYVVSNNLVVTVVLVFDDHIGKGRNKCAAKLNKEYDLYEVRVNKNIE